MKPFRRSTRSSPPRRGDDGSEEAASHDKMIEGLSPEAVLAANAHLSRFTKLERKNPEHRWIIGRRAALRRKISTLKI